MSSVAVMEPQAGAVVASPSATVTNADTLFGAIIRAVESGADIEKMERMTALYERVKANEAKARWVAAMAKAQPELPAIKKLGKNKGTNSAYALWEHVNIAITPILAKHGLTLTFRLDVRPAEKMAHVTAVVAYSDGGSLHHSEETTVPQPIESVNRAMNNNQAIQSAVSYGKRSAGGSILNLTYVGEDDDAAAAGAGETISADQYEQINRWLEEAEADPDRFASVMRVESLHLLPASRYDEAIRKIEGRAREIGVTLSGAGDAA